jgi:hypothetical protein
MTAKSEASRALYEAFRAALLLTASAEGAEHAVLDGIAKLESGHISDDVLLVEAVKVVIRQRADFPSQPEPAPSGLPWELQRLFLLAPIPRDCFMLRVLLGIPGGTCSRILRLGIEEIGEVMCSALQELPLLAARDAARHEGTRHKASTDAKGA